MTDSPHRSRGRRRASRPSTAPEYDKTADLPVKGRPAGGHGVIGAIGAGTDGERWVELDDDSNDVSAHADLDARYDDERPPHYGGD